MFFLSGAAGLVYQVAWDQYLLLFTGQTAFSHALVLAAFMGGLSLGSFYGGFWADRSGNRLRLYAGLEGLIALWTAATPLLIEWGGALRWLKTNADAGTVRAAAARVGGHATLFRAKEKAAGAFSPLSPILARLHRDLKAAFDPAGILNPGRLYEGL